MATTTTVKTAADTFAGYIDDSSITAALINTDSPTGLQDSMIALYTKLGRLMQLTGLGSPLQVPIHKA